MIQASWAFRLLPLPDELLSSWLTRCAYAHGQGVHVFRKMYLPDAVLWCRDIDRSPAQSIVSRLAELGRLEPASLESCTLAALGGLKQMKLSRGRWPWVLSVGVYHRLRRRHGLQFCRACLAETPLYYRRIWRLGFMTRCPLHGERLFDACPHCDATVSPHRSLALQMECCHFCGFDFRASSVDDDQNLSMTDECLPLQAALSDAISGRSVSWNAHEFSPVDFLLIARILVGTLTSSNLHRFRSLFELPAIPKADIITPQACFDEQRIDQRYARLQSLNAWIGGWPETFISGARSMGLTQRSFARCNSPVALQRLIERLPPGQLRRRRNQQSGPEHHMRRLRCVSPAAYRQARARRLLALAGAGV